jgi:hypothetical protein
MSGKSEVLEHSGSGIDAGRELKTLYLKLHRRFGKCTDDNGTMEQQVRTSGDNVVYWEGTARNNTPGEAE